MPPFVGGVGVGVDEGEFGQSGQGAPAAAGRFLLHLDGSDAVFGSVVGERDGQVGGEPQDHVLKAAEPVVRERVAVADQDADDVGQDPAVVDDFLSFEQVMK